MKHNKAIKIAVECIRNEMRKYAFDANLYKRMGAGAGPTAKKAAEHYDELDGTIAYLEDLVNETTNETGNTGHA
jgi:hypothetical protein